MLNLGNIDQNQILQYVDIAFWVLLGLMFGGMLLAFLRGLIRGWKHGTFRTIFLTAMAVALLLLMPIWVDIIGQFPINSFYGGPIHMEIQGSAVDVPVTTTFNTAFEFIRTVLVDVFHVRASTESIIAYSIALAGSFVRLLIVFLVAFLTSTVGSFLSWVLWHLIFKRFTPKAKRKPKARIISGLEEAVVWFGLLALMVIPFSGLANAIRNNIEIPEDETNDTLKLVNRVLDSYDQSVFNKVFFEWTKGSGNKTLDTQLAEFFAQNSFTSSAGYTAEANIIKEFSVIASVEGTLGRWMFSEDPSQSTGSALIHTSLLMGNTLYEWARSSEANELLHGLVPLTLDVASNIDEIEKENPGDVDAWLGLDGEDGHPTRLMRAYNRVAESDYVSTLEDVFQGDYAVPLYDSSCSYSDSYLALVREEIESSPRRRQMVNAVISGYVLGQMESNPSWQKSRGSLPSLASAFASTDIESIDWWKEANLFHDVETRLEDLEPEYADSANSSQDLVQELTDSFMSALARDPNRLIEVLIGKRTPEGEPVTDDKGNNQEFLCLLDSDLIATILPIALEVGAEYVDQEVLTDEADQKVHEDISTIAVEFQGNRTSETRINFKREFGAILDVPGKIASSDAGKAFIKDYASHPGVDFAENGTIINIDKSIAEAIKSGVECIDKSRVMNAIGAPVADHFVRPLLDPNEGALGKLGITEIALYEDHEGKRINIGKELSSLLDIGVYCNDVVPVIGAMVASDSETSMPVETLLESLAKLEDEDSHYQLTHMLDIICKSKIFNPIVKEGDKVVYNTNVSGILDYLLSSLPGETAINIDTADLQDMDLTSSWDGENIGSTRGENFYLMNCVKTIIDSGLVSKIGDFSGANPTKIMTTLASIPVDDVFASVGQSKILRKSAASIFDNMILKAIFGEDGYQDAVDIGVTYKNLVTPEDWTNEGVAIQSIIDLAYRGLDISQLDPFNPAVVDMLAKLSKSGMFFSAFDEEGTLRDEKEYVFPRFLQDKLLLNLNSKDMMNLFVDYPHKVVDGKSIQDILDETSDWNEKLEQKEKICTVFCSSIASLTTPEEWDTEFGLLKDILQCLNAAGGMEAMNNFDMDKLPALTGAIGYLNHSKVFGPVLLSNAIHMALNSGELPEEIADAEINEGYLYHNAELIVAAREEGKDTTALEEARNTEIRSILRLMDVAAADSDLDINIATLEVEGMLHPMLETLSTSKLFNPTHVSEMYPGEALPEITAFENVVCTIMTKAKLYTDHDGNEITTNDVKVKGSEKTIKDIVLGVSDWDTEIVSICDLIITLQNSSFITDAGELDFSAMTDLDSYFAKSGAHQELQFMLNSLMDSETFYRCLPPKLEESVHDGLSNITMNNLADDLWCADFLYTRNSDGTDFDPYDEEEVERFITVLDHLAPCMKMDTSDLNSVDVDSLSLALEAMGGSMIFNSNTELSSTVAWHDYLPGDPDYRGGKTCFQLFAADMTSVEALEDYFYNASSPKDVAFVTSYTSAKQKEVYVLASLLPAYDGSNLGAVEAAVNQYLSQEWGDCVRTLQSSTFDAFFSASSPSIADLSEDALANMLHCLNDCTIYRDCVPNALQKTIVQGDSIQQVKDAGVDLENADFYFSYYYHDGHGNFAAPSAYSWSHPDFNMPFYAPEIDQIAMLYSLLLDDSSLIEDPSFDTINPLVLRSLLHDVHDSYALHDSSRLVPTDDLTVFEQFMKAFLLKSGVYDGSLEGAGEDETKIIKGTAMTVKKMIGNIDPSHWVNEIENLYELIVHMQESDSFTDSEGSLDLSAISDLDTFFPSGTPEKDATRAQNKHNLAELIRYVEKGEILYRLLPARLEKALKDSLNTSNDLMSKIREDLRCADYYFSQFGSGESLDFKPYSYFVGDESEVDSLVNLFEDISFLQQIDLTDLDTIETDRLVSAMTNMGINRIFNSNITKSETVFAGTTRAGLTAHQAVLCDAVYFDVVSAYYFQAASPKDAYHATEHDYGEKATYEDNVYDKIGYTIGTTISTLNAYTDVESESALISATHAYMDATETPYQEWATCIEDMKAPEYRRFVKQLDDIEDITEKSTMTGILNALNDCSFYTDAVSNALYRALYLERPFTVNGIDFDSSDVYFSYRYDFDTNGEILGTRGAVTPARLANHFYRTEIDTIVDIYFGFKDNEARFSAIDLGDELLPVKLNEILTDMSQSYIFHVSIKEGGRRPFNAITGVDDTFEDLSVFEQMIYKFVHDTTLDNSSYLPLRDYRYEFASDGSKKPFGAQRKLHDRILAYSESSDWALEINALTTDGMHHDGDDADPVVGIIDAGQKAKIFASGSGDVSVDYESLKKVAPAKI
ncbi:MAG: hypothetical protein IJ787_06890, partial [Bacilli bacterium]|nr:hypothetical protein [Bacilli bacterium]